MNNISNNMNKNTQSMILQPTNMFSTDLFQNVNRMESASLYIPAPLFFQQSFIPQNQFYSNQEFIHRCNECNNFVKHPSNTNFGNLRMLNCIICANNHNICEKCVNKKVNFIIRTAGKIFRCDVKFRPHKDKEVFCDYRFSLDDLSHIVKESEIIKLKALIGYNSHTFGSHPKSLSEPPVIINSSSVSHSLQPVFNSTFTSLHISPSPSDICHSSFFTSNPSLPPPTSTSSLFISPSDNNIENLKIFSYPLEHKSSMQNNNSNLTTKEILKNLKTNINPIEKIYINDGVCPVCASKILNDIYNKNELYVYFDEINPQTGMKYKYDNIPKLFKCNDFVICKECNVVIDIEMVKKSTLEKVAVYSE
jgi:hypothetical protein